MKEKNKARQNNTRKEIKEQRKRERKKERKKKRRDLIRVTCHSSPC